MKVKFILPALKEAKSPFWRPIKYSLFPPLGLATLATWLNDECQATIVDEHVQELTFEDKPDLVVIQVYITNAKRAYCIADIYRAKGSYVILGGLHVTTLPEEAEKHADTIFLGPGEDTFPKFLKDFKNKSTLKRYYSTQRTLGNLKLPRRDLINRDLYFVPNSLVISRGCPHNCSFCYNKSFYKGGKSFYTRRIDKALEEIESLPGKHLYFLDDHLFGDSKYIKELFFSMRGMDRVFQGAATVESILKDDTINHAVHAGLRSLFVGFETLSPENLKSANKNHNLGNDYKKAIEKLHSLGVMINGSFVFGLDNDDKDVFKRTVDWAINNGITTATFHILTPYPGTTLFDQLQRQNRILTTDWDLYDTRHTVYQPVKLSIQELEQGYNYAYKEFYKWKSIFKNARAHKSLKSTLKKFAYTAAWKKFEPVWNFLIKTKSLKYIRPLLEKVLHTNKKTNKKSIEGNLKPLAEDNYYEKVV